MGKTEEDIAGKEKSLKENALRKNMSSLNSGIKSSDVLKASNTVKNSNTSNTLKGKAFEDRAVAFLAEKG